MELAEAVPAELKLRSRRCQRVVHEAAMFADQAARAERRWRPMQDLFRKLFRDRRGISPPQNEKGPQKRAFSFDRGDRI
jgi:hypothetical protein